MFRPIWGLHRAPVKISLAVNFTLGVCFAAMGIHPLRAWRDTNGITLAALADEVDVTASHLSEIERGIGTPSIKLARRLSEATQRLRKRGGGTVDVAAIVSAVPETAA